MQTLNLFRGIRSVNFPGAFLVARSLESPSQGSTKLSWGMNIMKVVGEGGGPDGSMHTPGLRAKGIFQGSSRRGR